MMNSAFSKIMVSCFFIFLLVSGGFILSIILFEVNLKVIIAGVLYIVLVAVLFVIYTLLIRKQINDILSKLSDTIYSLMDMQDNTVFSTIEESMLSKLQAQIIKLSNILKAQNQRYQDDSRAVKSLISDISHQLKTPLTNLNMYHSLLMNPHLSEDKRCEFNQNIQSQIERLNWLMESLITMSRLESGVIELSKENLNLENTVLTAIKQVLPKANQNQTNIQLICDQQFVIKHDTRWTAEAIFTLLDNAVKYNEPLGRIKISIQKYELFVRIDVIDDGLGIKEEEINQIFKRFYRGENAKHIQGVGIGLYLVRKIISQQGGYLKVNSVVGEGSTFSIFLLLSMERL